MNRPILVCALLLMATAALGAQEASQSSPYEGTSNPPPDDTITATIPDASAPLAKPPAGQPLAPLAAPVQAPAKVLPQSVSVDSDVRSADADPDGGIVEVRQNAPAPEGPLLSERAYAADPDGDIVHPPPLSSNELAAGTTIRVRLLDRLSTTDSEKDDFFRSRVTSDVLQGNHVLIPAGAEIDGRVSEVSSGHFGGRGSMHLLPETVILANGTRYRLHAEITGTPGAKTKVGPEGTVLPGSRGKRDAVEYGGTVGVGATTGAILGGPVGALAGGLVGAGVITTHLLVSHPQATLEPGAVLLFTLSKPLNLVPASSSGGGI